MKGDEKLLFRIISIFRKQFPYSLELLKVAIEKHDFASARFIAHTLTGQIGNFDDVSALNALRALDLCALQNNSNGMEIAFNKLKEELSALDSALNLESDGSRSIR